MLIVDSMPGEHKVKKQNQFQRYYLFTRVTEQAPLVTFKWLFLILKM